jgi:hypothetical protein
MNACAMKNSDYECETRKDHGNSHECQGRYGARRGRKAGEWRVTELERVLASACATVCSVSSRLTTAPADPLVDTTHHPYRANTITSSLKVLDQTATCYMTGPLSHQQPKTYGKRILVHLREAPTTFLNETTASRIRENFEKYALLAWSSASSSIHLQSLNRVSQHKVAHAPVVNARSETHTQIQGQE